jgi:hypothetical protein
MHGHGHGQARLPPKLPDQPEFDRPDSPTPPPLIEDFKITVEIIVNTAHAPDDYIVSLFVVTHPAVISPPVSA